MFFCNKLSYKLSIIDMYKSYVQFICKNYMNKKLGAKFGCQLFFKIIKYHKLKIKIKRGNILHAHSNTRAYLIDNIKNNM